MWNPQEVGTGKATKVLYRRAGAEMGLKLGKQQENRSVGSLPGFLASMAYGLAGGPSGVEGWGKVTK